MPTNDTVRIADLLACLRAEELLLDAQLSLIVLHDDGLLSDIERQINALRLALTALRFKLCGYTVVACPHGYIFAPHTSSVKDGYKEGRNVE